MRRIKKCLVLLVFVPVFLSGCVDSLGLKQKNSNVEFVRGIVSKDDSQFTITPCYSQERRRLDDPRGLLKKHFSGYTGSTGLPTYMEVKAEQGVDLVWRIDDVMVAGGGSKMCHVNLSNIRFRAQGGNPPWLADVLPGSVRVQSYETLRTLNFPIDSFDGTQGVWESSLKGVKGQSYSLRLEIRDQPCTDALNIWYRWSTSMDLSGNTFQGCARQGDLTNRALLGRYSNLLTDNEAFVVLDILPENMVSMLLDYRNGQALIVMQGTWQWKSNDKLIIHFTQQDGRKQESVLLLRRAYSGEFVQEGFSSEFGRAGISLKRSE
ncbi:hypothetical protein [Neptunomonas sp.]|uniref:hypothetical protein n=1 Tax=Neptunomonas sp. TaxID=1971898 RepID=UPI0025CB956D|nr:hypothetical protein [Neptunomonas sp.]